MSTVTDFSSSSPQKPSSTSLKRKDWIAGLDRGLALMECFGQEHSRLSATDVAQLSGMARTAARRYLLTLVHLGYMATDGKLYWRALPSHCSSGLLKAQEKAHISPS
jgi:hypothetical protein